MVFYVMTKQPRLLQQVRNEVRSPLYFFTTSTTPQVLDKQHIKAFLTYLAVERNVAPST